MRLPSLFCDHMVVQRETPVRFWGWTTPQQAVIVSMAGHTVQTNATNDGQWQASLPALPAGGPYELIITGDESITFHDVMVGEVWVCSGQSNMEMGITMVQDASVEVANAQYPNIRLFTVAHSIQGAPQEDAPGASWLVCSPETILHGAWGGFSASAYFFGRELAQKLNVPIGLIHSSWGGTVVEAWTSREALLTDDDGRDMVERLDASIENYEEYIAEYKQRFLVWEEQNVPKDPGNVGVMRGWAMPDYATPDWQTMTLPCTWQSTGLRFSGSLWFRKEITIPEAWVGQELSLHLGWCDKDDTTYFNGQQVGGLSHYENPESWCTPRIYTVPSSLVKAGRAVIAVRAFSYAFDGGLRGPAEEMYLEAPGMPDTKPLVLSGDWQYIVEHNLGLVELPAEPELPIGRDNPNSPTMLYNGMIAPLINYTIRGAIWYQGESNSSRAAQYQRLFPLMIKDWREKWGLGDFPFIFVQLANYILNDCDRAKGHWAELREAQTMTLQLPNTGMAITADIGIPHDIHPTNKQEVGRRLALNALAKVYGQSDLIYSGPFYRAAEVDGNALRISFDHVGGGLRAADGDTALEGFQIAGADQVFVPATARIDGDTVVVSSPQITEPAAVRYAWEDCPTCTLYNAQGLPASPFRTDAWSILVPLV